MSVGATEESHHQMRKSPTGLEEENDLLQAPTGSAKLVIKERNPGSTSREDQTRTEDAEDMDTQRQPSKAVTIPNSILEWLDSPAHRRRPILQPELDQNMNKKELLQRRLAIFSYHDALSYKTLYPIDHPLGRVVRPREKENYEENPYEIDGWPDDSLSWTPPPLAQETEVRKRQEELRLIERYLDSESDSEEGSVDERLHANDPANAKLALRVKKSSRAWLANKAVPARSPMPTPPKPRTPPKASKRTRASSVSETEPPVEMEVDKVDDEDSDEIACICKGVDDGRPMVQGRAT
ncbi:hypothetical protein FRC17_002129 [Serendipita sp. 399]|nr:hypothetical protein FRC17_002129 [Serendipita sp. 399]